MLPAVGVRPGCRIRRFLLGLLKKLALSGRLKNTGILASPERRTFLYDGRLLTHGRSVLVPN